MIGRDTRKDGSDYPDFIVREYPELFASGSRIVPKEKTYTLTHIKEYVTRWETHHFRIETVDGEKHNEPNALMETRDGEYIFYDVEPTLKTSSYSGTYADTERTVRCSYSGANVIKVVPYETNKMAERLPHETEIEVPQSALSFFSSD